MQEKRIQNNQYLFWIIVIALVVLSFFIIKPYIITLISAFILAYLVKPVFNYLKPKLGDKLSATLCIILIFIIILLPLGAIIGGVIKQASDSLNEGTVKSLIKEVSSYPLIQKLNLNVEEITKDAISLLISLLKSVLTILPSIIITLLLIIFSIFYILIEWDFLSEKLKVYLPFKDKTTISKEIAQTTNNLIYGTLFIGFLQFIISLVALFILGVKSYLLFSALIFIFAFIPALGAAAVCIPLTVYYFLTNEPITAIGLIVLAAILNIGIDTMLRIKLLGKSSKIHPMVMLLGILGGIHLFGIFGFIIGPLILIYTLQLIEDLLEKR